MTIRVELFGIPRVRAGVGQTSVLAGRSSATIAEVLDAVAQQVPGFAGGCLDNGMLRDGIVANIDGERFEPSPDSIITESQTLLILSADAGG